MQRLRSTLLPLMVLLLAALPACASGGGAAGEGMPATDASTVAVQVNNDLVVPSNVTVYLIPNTGSRSLLGTVSPGDTETLTYRGATAGGMYRLMARTTSGNEIVSTAFNLSRGDTVEWRLATNSVVVGG